jgi:hypothetical protein
MAELRGLTAFAVDFGANRARVNRLADALVDLLLDSRDPRRKRTLALAERIARARDAGVSIPVLCERFGRSRSRLNRLLALWRATSRATYEIQSSHRHNEDSA